MTYMSFDVESGSGLYFIPKIPFSPVVSYSYIHSSSDRMTIICPRGKSSGRMLILPIFKSPFLASCQVRHYDSEHLS